MTARRVAIQDSNENPDLALGKVAANALISEKHWSGVDAPSLNFASNSMGKGGEARIGEGKVCDIGRIGSHIQMRFVHVIPNQIPSGISST